MMSRYMNSTIKYNLHAQIWKQIVKHTTRRGHENPKNIIKKLCIYPNKQKKIVHWQSSAHAQNHYNIAWLFPNLKISPKLTEQKSGPSSYTSLALFLISKVTKVTWREKKL